MLARSVDEANAAFWQQLCGTELAREIGITGVSDEELDRYDAAYLAFYPYLDRYLSPIRAGERVLEIGTGYGTVGRWLLSRGVDYTALDISPGPVAMAAQSLARFGRPVEQAVLGSALAIPFGDGSFDHVVAIGSLHHTGDLPKALGEAHRVVKPGGRALVMVYNGRSLNRLVTTPAARVLARLWPAQRQRILARTIFDRDDEGNAAPHTDYVSAGELRRLASGFRTIRIEPQDANALSIFGRALVPRSLLLPTLGRVAGLHLYAELRK